MALDINFALEGFRIIKRRPALVPIWGGAMLVSVIIAFGALLAGMIPIIVAATANKGRELDPARVPAMMLGLVLPMILSVIVIILAMSVVQCAIYRAALEDKQTSFGYLRLGAEELRNVLVNFLFVFVVFGLELVAGAAGLLGGGLLGLVLSLIHKDLMALGLVLGMLAAVVGFFWVLMRLSLFSVQSFDQKQVNLFGSWTLTRGNSFSLIIGYIIAALLGVVFHFICSFFLMIVAGVLIFAGAAAAGIMSQTATPDVMAILAAVGPGIAVYVLGFGLLIMPTIVTITAGAPAGAYRRLAGIRLDSAEDIF